MTARRIPTRTLVAVLLATIAGLVARTVIQGQFTKAGISPDIAADVSYLIVPVVLALLLFPLWRTERSFLAKQFHRADLSYRVVVNAIVIGFIMRFIWWSQLIAGVSFGIYYSADPDAIVGPVFSFRCAAPDILVLGFVVMAILVPVIEEVVHRGYFLTAFRQRGFFVSILISALIFAVLHRVASLPYVFLAGLVLGTQYWITRSLWSSVLTHATMNGLVQIDWRCMSGQWNPQAADIPVVIPGVLALVTLAGCLLTLYVLLRKMATGAHETPR